MPMSPTGTVWRDWLCSYVINICLCTSGGGMDCEPFSYCFCSALLNSTKRISADETRETAPQIKSRWAYQPQIRLKNYIMQTRLWAAPDGLKVIPHFVDGFLRQKMWWGFCGEPTETNRTESVNVTHYKSLAEIFYTSLQTKTFLIHFFNEDSLIHTVLEFLLLAKKHFLLITADLPKAT